MKDVLKEGDWWVVVDYGRYQILHHCERAVFSWAREPEYPNRDRRMQLKVDQKAWAAVRNTIGSNYRTWEGCIACNAVPPETMRGFVKLLEWEK